MYRTIASRLREEIADAEWFNGSLEFDFDEIHARLTLTAVIYRRTETLPEGTRRPVSDVVPVWWEFSAETDDRPAETDPRRAGSDTSVCAPTDPRAAGPQKRPRLNTFSFSELKPCLIDYD